MTIETEDVVAPELWAVLYLHDWDPPQNGKQPIYPEIHGVFSTWQEAEAEKASKSTPEQYYVRRAKNFTNDAQLQSLSDRIAVLNLAERKWRELDPHGTSVIRGVPDDFYGDDPRINVFDEKVDAGEKPKLTVGLFLGEHKWAMQRFSPEQLIGIVGLILSRPSVRASLIKEGSDAK